ncbi:DNA-binding protein, partial [Bacteroides uniformis]
VSKIGMAPRGVVKLVLDGLIDTLNMDINKGFSVQLGEFGCFRPGINAKSQDKLEDVTASTIYRRKIIFTPGFYFRDMLTRASVEKMDWSGNGTVSGGGSSKPNPDGGGSDGDQGENPLG